MKSVDICLAIFGIAASSMICLVGLFGLINGFHNEVRLDWVDTDTFRHWTAEVNPLFASAQHATLLIIIGVFSFLAEINFEWVLREFHLFALLFSHGMFYIVSGFLCLGIAGNMGILLGTIVGCIGVLYILFTLFIGNRVRIEYAEL